MTPTPGYEVQLEAVYRGGVVLPNDKEETPGAFLAVNADDDLPLGTIDLEQQRPGSNEDDLLQVRLRVVPPQPKAVDVVLYWDGPAKRLWKREKRGALTAVANGALVKVGREVVVLDLEAVAPSAATRDGSLSARSATAPDASDRLALTAVSISWLPDADLDGGVDEADARVSLTRGAFLSLNEDDDDGNGKPDLVDAEVRPRDPPAPGAREDTTFLRLRSRDFLPPDLAEGIVRLDGHGVRAYQTRAKRSEGGRPPEAPRDLSVAAEKAELLAWRELWLEGRQASEDLRDHRFRAEFSPPGAPAQVWLPLPGLAATVVRFEEIRLVLSMRPDPGGPVKPGTRQKEATPPCELTTRKHPSQVFSNRPDDGKPIHLYREHEDLAVTFRPEQTAVLLSGSDDTVDLCLETRPKEGLPVAWALDRAPDDADAARRLGNPSLGRGTLAPAGAGSFFLRAYLDVDGDGRIHEEEPRLVLPVAIVAASPPPAIEATANTRHLQNLWSARRAFHWIVSGRIEGTPKADPRERDFLRPGFDLEKPGDAAIQLRASVTLTGGGPDGLRGTEAVHSGWVNNMTSFDTVGTYTTFTRRLVMAWRTPAGGDRDWGDEPRPPLIDWPLLDTNREPRGGASATPELHSVTTREGPTLTARFIDSPSWSMAGVVDGNALTRYRLDIGFRANLLLWVERGEEAVFGNRTYMKAGHVDWVVRREVNVAGDEVAAGNVPAPRVRIEESPVPADGVAVDEPRALNTVTVFKDRIRTPTPTRTPTRTPVPTRTPTRRRRVAIRGSRSRTMT